MNVERLEAMRRAGFRVLGFGIESFSPRVLAEFNKAQIHRHIEPMLTAARAAGITPFLDLILSSPRARLEDVATTLREAYLWLRRGCEIGMYPYVIPFSGAALAQDPQLLAHTVSTRRRVAGTSVEWDQPSKILPIDPAVRSAILEIEREFETLLGSVERARRASAFARALADVDPECLAGHGAAGVSHRRSTMKCMPQLQERLPQVREASAPRAVANA